MRLNSVTLLASLLLAACGGSAAAPSAPVSSAAAAASPASPAAANAAPVSASPAAASASTAARSTAASPAASGTIKVPIGYSGALSDMPIMIAVQKGYFREQGLDVELNRINSIQGMTAPLATGQLLVGAGGITASIFNAISRDVPLTIVADRNYVPKDYTGTGWAVRTEVLDNGAIKTPKDLKGRAVVIGARGGTAETEMDVMLREAGLTLKDLDLKEVSFPDQVAAFANKNIDVAYTFEPYITTMTNQKLARMWMPSGQIIPNHEQSVIFYSPVFKDKYPDAAKNWMVAYVKGVRDYVNAYAHPPLPSDVVAAMTTYGSEPDPAKVQLTKLTPINPDAYPFKESLNAEVSYFNRAGLVTNPPDLSKVVDSSFVDYAISKLGKYQPA